MSRPPRPEPVTVIGRRPVPPPLQNLHHRLLDKAIQHGRNAQLPHPASVLFLNLHPSYRLRFIGPIQQLFPDGWPVLLQVVAKLVDGHPIDTRATLAFTRRNASFRLSRSRTSSINRFVLTGLSGSFTVESDSVSALPASRASPAGVVEKFSS